LQDTVSQQLTVLREQMQETDWGRSLLGRLPFGFGETGSDSSTTPASGIGSIIPRLAGVVAGALWSVLGLLGTVGVILVAALYMAAAPVQYVHGIIQCHPN
jgi:hypothetical protein